MLGVKRFRAVHRAILFALMFSGWASAATVQLADGGRYDGEMEDGLLHGSGTLVWTNGDRYVGQFQVGLMHGNGVLELAGGDRYEGEMREGKFHGQGVLENADQSRYEGNFAYGYPSGQGSIRLVNGDFYTGEFALGRPSGQGLFRYSDGTEYEGQFSKGVENGQGEMRFPSGDTYIGEFENREIIRGVWLESSGDRYEGGFSNWRFDGDGVIDTATGRFSGNFDAGYLMKGVHERTDGGRYEGAFDGFFDYHGVGRLTAADGTVTAGEFSYGRYEGPQKLWIDSLAENAFALVDSLTPGHRMTARDPAELLSEKSLYLQVELLGQALDMLAPQQPDQTDLYIVHVAGDGRQEVFRREVELASDYFAAKWNAEGRIVTLANSRTSVERLPMATRSSLRQALGAVAETMDREQDILFLYLTSHGGRDHEFSLAQNGMRLPDLSAGELGEMLSEIEVKNKVVVVSACFSGGFIPHLDDGQTLVMTSARADRQSFGCADENDMTDFGRAFLSEAIPNTDSFVEAFELAKRKVAQWEGERNLTPSEPQILRAENVEKQLAVWRAELSTAMQDADSK